MKKKRLLAAACACVMATGLCSGALVALAEEGPSTEPTTPETPVVTNYFKAPGFDEMLVDDEEEYALTDVQRCHTGSFEGAVAKKEADGNVYLELKGEGFCSFFSMMTIPEAGDYKISVDFQKSEDWEGTDNVGFRLYNAGHDSAGWAKAINDAPTGEWFTLTETYSVALDKVSSVDSFSLWFNTMSDPNNVLMVDNVVVEYIVPDEGAPSYGEGELGTVNWREEDGGDVTFKVNLKGSELDSVINKETEEEYSEGAEYTYDATEGTITFDADFVYDLGEGTHTITLTTEGGSLDLVITVYYKALSIPETTDGYTLEDTMLGGDFEGYEVGLKFSEKQTEEAWGSLAGYDDPATIVDDNGNHALRLGRADGSNKMYSSSFCIWDPKINQGDILTLKFSYKILGDIENIGSNTNVSFVGSANTDYHLIDVVKKNETTIEGNKNVQSWPVKYTENENGYTDVEVSFIVDFAFMNSTNSLRFLYQIGEGTEIYFDNVRLIRWVDEAAVDAEKPVATGANLAFDGKNQKDVTLTISKTYLATLANGKHTFTLTTLGGTCEFEITVTNSTATTKPANVKNDDDTNVGLIVGLSVGGAAVVAAGAAAAVILVRKKKKNGKKDTKDTVK